MGLQASLVHISEARPDLCETFLNRLFAMLNWTLTEFTVSAQVRNQLPRLAKSLFSSHCLTYPVDNWGYHKPSVQGWECI